MAFLPSLCFLSSQAHWLGRFLESLHLNLVGNLRSHGFRKFRSLLEKTPVSFHFHLSQNFWGEHFHYLLHYLLRSLNRGLRIVQYCLQAIVGALVKAKARAKAKAVKKRGS